ncbi:calcium-independent phospholipase A2-gamma-like [Myripristis murdjan]|uniref:Calcium-independent phospholipase A2-gamma-like n=1 Tax=Myripristis murdjan TaxID=586833 RepID=A0A667ZZ92_9TELE|nr:calcium-independent phospholipase A2-gamma-like [Myripristis murdjan]XP_029910945.1 calcium-independent phospholipase A2-gamma-like [Myripristis murdjan]XP_029910946.1 calcium-independent phospholipase A2-gamma-like [Myripristis murdjan]
MGRYLSTNLLSHSLDGRTLRLYCKIKHLISILRNFPRLAKTPFALNHHRYSVLSSPRASSCTRIAVFTNTKFKHSNRDCTSGHFLRHGTLEMKPLRAVRFYSSSNRDTLRAEAPIGIVQDAQSTFHLRSLGERLGQSFNRLSRHINIYFKGKDIPIVPLAGNVNLVVTTPEHLGRLQRRSQNQRAARERRPLEDTLTLKCKDKQETSEAQPDTSTSLHVYPGLQLFHISSLATRFGESYSYVANHINSVFSRGPAKEVQIHKTLGKLSSDRRTIRRQRRRMPTSHSENSKMNANQATVKSNNISSNWEESYLYFARHINRYFGAKVADGPGQDRKHKEHFAVENSRAHQEHFSAQSASKTQAVPLKLKQEHLSTNSRGLFHTSSHTTDFGESYFQMATHINNYFKGPGALGDGMDGNAAIAMDRRSATTQELKTVSFMDCLRHPTSAIPNLLGGYLNLGTWVQPDQPKPAAASLKTTFKRRLVLNSRQAQEETHGMIGSLGQALSPEALTACVEALNEHLIRYPSCKALLWQEKTAVTLLKKRRSYRDNENLQSAIRETLALIGFIHPVKGRGIRVLSIDGGGTRGVVPLQVLKLLEAETGKHIHQLFDYICGVSTGAVLAFMLGLARFSLAECEEMYRRFGSDVFRQNPLVGTVKMGWSHSYYNTETWEMILREKLGERVLIKTARDELSPKVSAVSAVVNWGKSPKAFVFRNYNHTPGCLSRYAGGSGYQMWQAVRASSAAPGYFQEFTLQSDVHQDGGIILNNPCALAVNESRLLWPNQPFQCVLSLGTGRYDNVKRGPATSTSLRAKISNLISSATDTEGVHTLLDDLLAPDVYFRFNPMLSAEVSLDESRPMALDQLQRDTQVYLERNRPKLARLCLVLGAERSTVSRTRDWISGRAWEMKQRWV